MESSKPWELNKMSSWQKKLHSIRFPKPVPCPYCPLGTEPYKTSLTLIRHVLNNHNWNKQFLEGFEIVKDTEEIMVLKENRKNE